MKNMENPILPLILNPKHRISAMHRAIFLLTNLRADRAVLLYMVPKLPGMEFLPREAMAVSQLVDFLEAMVLAEILKALAVMEAEDMAVHLPEVMEDTEEGMDDDLWRFENYRRKCRRI